MKFINSKILKIRSGRNFVKKYQKYVDEYNEKVKDLCDFEGKFLKIEVEENYRYAYLYCNTVMLTKDLSGNQVILLRGYGFTYLVTDYEDDTFCNWDQFFEHTIYINSLERDIKEIKIISKEEYDEAFENLLMEIKQEHYNYIKE